MKKFLLLALLFSAPLRAEVFDIGEFNLDRYLGRVVYLDFWASWCKPCRKSFPWMNALLDKYPADAFTVVTINLDADSAAMQRFLEQLPARFDVYHDPSGHLAEKFDLQGMPTSYLIDADGKARARHIGFYESKKADYEAEIEAML